MSHPQIQLRQLDRIHVQAGVRVPVLRDIHLDISQGEFLSIVGPSGSGKTTLLNVLGLMDHDWSGEYWLDGSAVHQAGSRQRQALQRSAVGFIFQHYHLLDDLTVAENLELPLSYRDLPAAERRERVRAALARFGLEGKKGLYPAQLSGGQQQLVAVARAVIARPRLLLADEPTGALHSSQGREIMALLTELNSEGMTIVQVTHNPDFAAVAQRIVEMRDGTLGAA
jgi:ABC-type lipoprotein export system ATPase subunit